MRRGRGFNPPKRHANFVLSSRVRCCGAAALRLSLIHSVMVLRSLLLFLIVHSSTCFVQQVLRDHRIFDPLTRFLCMNTDAYPAEILQSVAERAARAAGRLMLAGIQESDLRVESKIGSRDIVTRVDKEVQECIRSM